MAVPSKHPQLTRELNLSQTLAVVVGTVIGSGIFLVPTEMMQAVGSARLVYLAWVIGGLLSFFGALTYAELGAMKPEAGGEYVYIRDAYGPLPGFLYAWTWFVIAKPASIATLTSGLVRVLGTFAGFSFLAHDLVRGPFPINYGQLIAVGITLCLTFLNYLGIKKAGEFQLVFTLIKVGVIVAIIVVGFSYPAGQWEHFVTGYTGAQGGMAGFMAALVAALWAYDGWNDLSMISGEVRDPERNIPVSLIVGVGIIVALYILTNVAVEYVLPAAAIATTERPASDAVALVLGWRGAWLVSAGMAISILVAMNGTIMSGARVPYAAARDRYFFPALAEVHPRFHSPGAALFAQAAFSIALLLLGGSYRQLFSLTIFSEWLFYMLAASTIFVFRRRDPQLKRPYCTWGYPLVPLLFVFAAAVLLYYTFADNLMNSALGCLVIVAGIPVFLFFAHKREGVTP